MQGVVCEQGETLPRHTSLSQRHTWPANVASRAATTTILPQLAALLQNGSSCINRGKSWSVQTSTHGLGLAHFWAYVFKELAFVNANDVIVVNHMLDFS